MNKFELWRQRRRERSAGEATATDDVPAADADANANADAPAPSAEPGIQAAGPEHGIDLEDTVPAAFYRNIG